MSRKYLIVSLRRPMESFFEFEPEDISPEGFDVENVQKVLSELHPGMTWSDEGNGMYFGRTPCPSSIEAWLEPGTRCLLVAYIWKEEVIELASRLGLTAFDVQNGERLYSPDD